MIYERKIEIRWADCDINRHVRHSAYYDYGAHARVRFIADAGFDEYKLSTLQLGPVIFNEQCHFIREIRMNDTIRVNMLLDEMNDDGSKWKIHHEIFNQKDEKVAHITLSGAWMDTSKRKLTIPPKPLASSFALLERGDDYKRK